MFKQALAVMVLVAGTAGPAAAQDAASAEAFLRGLYARYAAKPDFSPFADPATVTAIATPSLAALVKRDLAASAAAHDVGKLDFDPVCGCQDSDGMQVAAVAARVDAPGRATGTVTLRFGTQRVTRVMLLQAVGDAWRIDDIRDGAGGGDLRRILSPTGRTRGR